MAIKRKVEQGVAFAGVEMKLVIVAGDRDGFFGNSRGEGVFITGVVGRIDLRPCNVRRRGAAETIIVLAKGNIVIVVVVAFALFGTCFQENHIGFDAELK